MTKKPYVEIKLRCPKCGGKATVAQDDRGHYGWCIKERKVFAVKFI